MIEITLIDPAEGTRDVAEAETPEDAVFAGRTLWDEWCAEHPYQGWSRRLILVFAHNGKTIRMYEGTRP